MEPDRAYMAAMEWLHGLSRFGIRLGLQRMMRLLDALGRPEAGLPVLHVTGTNGKGSTSAVLAALLRAEGMSVGLYTSPHLSAFEERIQVDGQPIPRADVARLLGRVRDAVDELIGGGMEHPTEFEAITALGWMYFAERRVERVVLEVGLGGRHDATNAIPPPLCSVITGLALDHTDRLGDTIAEIAWDKAGIIKPETPAVVAGPGDALSLFAAVARDLDAPLWTVGEVDRPDGRRFDVTWRLRRASMRGCEFDLEGPWGRYSGLQVPLLGRHQAGNAAVAVAGWHAAASARADARRLDRERVVRRGLAAVRWPGRLEPIGDAPLVLLDGAHNPDGAAALAAACRELLPGRTVRLVCAVLADKAAESILAELLPVAAEVFATQVDSLRALPAADLSALAKRVVERASPARRPPVHVLPQPIDAVQAAVHSAGTEGVVLVAGSLYLVGAVRPWLLKINSPRGPT